MAVLQLDSVSFSYGGNEILSGVDVALQPGERVGVVGPNGVGKTTLLRIAAGELEPDAGRVIQAKATRLALLRQDQLASDRGTVLEALLEPFEGLLALRRSIAALERAMASSGELSQTAERYAALQAEYEAGGGDAVERRVEQLAADLDLGEGDLHRPVRTLSGGERRRLALAQVLASEPDLLLLDEPTNHLDVETLERLEELVTSFRGTVLVVSHDRVFLDRTCPITVELGATGAERYAGSYSWYVAERERRLESERRAYEREVAERERQEELIRRTVASGGFYSRQAKARMRRLERLEPVEAPTDVWAAAGATIVRPPPAPRSSRVTLAARGLSAERGGRRLFSGLDVQLERGERLGVVGPNGAGKTTLLRALMGDLPCEGEVTLGNGVISGICGQDLEELHPDTTPIDEIRSVRGELSTEQIRSHLGMLRIRGADQERKNATFSGGERARVALAKLLAVPRNLLGLDEPTNNLDIPAREVLEAALAAFEGTVVVVSHDRYFLERVATRLLHIEAGRVERFDGSYSELRSRLRRRSHAAPEAPREADPDKERRIAAHRERRERMRHRERLQRRQSELEEQVARAEDRVSGLDRELAVRADDWEALSTLQAERAAAGRRLDQLLAEWAETSEALEGAGEEDP